MKIFLRILGFLTFGLLPFVKDAFCLEEGLTCKRYWKEFVLPAFILALLGATTYRILLYFGVIFSLDFDTRRVIFALFLTPAFFALFLGQTKRLKYLGLWKIFLVLNFYPFYWGTLGLSLAIGLLPDMKVFGGQSQDYSKKMKKSHLGKK